MFSFITPITKNKQRVIVLVIIGTIAGTMAALSGIFLGADNPVEQAGEKVVNYTIQEATGIPADIDFSPGK